MLFPVQLPRPIPAAVFSVARLGRFFTCTVMLVLLLAGCAFGSSSPANTSGSTSTPTLATPTQHATYIYVAIGASETFGTGADRPATENWPTDLSAHLPRGVQVINLGIPGITAPQALQSELPEALDVKPNLVTVWLGTNDISGAFMNHVSLDEALGQYQQSLDSILSQLSANGHPPVAVANIPDLNLLPYFYNYDQTSLQAVVTKWNRVVTQEVKAHSDILVDVYSESSQLLGHPEYLSGDGLHPSTLGYEQIANYFYQVLKMNGVI